MPLTRGGGGGERGFNPRTSEISTQNPLSREDSFLSFTFYALFSWQKRAIRTNTQFQK